MAATKPPKLQTLPPLPIERLVKPFALFAKQASAGGIVLLACAIIAMAWANSPLGDYYFRLWATPVEVRFGDLIDIDKPLLLWINDGLMAVFFFLVGMEIKRELLVGELRSPRKAALSMAAALGGMVMPALIYVALNWGTPDSGLGRADGDRYCVRAGRARAAGHTRAARPESVSDRAGDCGRPRRSAGDCSVLHGESKD